MAVIETLFNFTNIMPEGGKNMTNDRINLVLFVIFLIILILGVLNDLPYCASVSFFLCLLFDDPMYRNYARRKRVKLGIAEADSLNVCLTRKQYLLLYVTSAVIGSILNVIAVFFSMPSYFIIGMDIIITLICSAIHTKMEH